MKYKADPTKNKKKEGLEDAQKVLSAAKLHHVLMFSGPKTLLKFKISLQAKAYKGISDNQRPDFIMKYNSLGLKSLSWIAAFTHKAEDRRRQEPGWHVHRASCWQYFLSKFKTCCFRIMPNICRQILKMNGFSPADSDSKTQAKLVEHLLPCMAMVDRSRMVHGRVEQVLLLNLGHPHQLLPQQGVTGVDFEC